MELNPIRCPMNDVVQFSTEYFQEGFKYNTIAGFSSTISAYHDPIKGISVGKRPRVTDHLIDIFNTPLPPFQSQQKFNFYLPKGFKQMAI